MQSGCSKHAGNNVRRKLYLALLGALSSSVANALPQGGQVTAGEASISVSDVQMDVHQESDRVVIEYDSFDVDSAETVNFHQPDVHSVALNRVVGNDLSSIHGRINANGQVFLINPNGVLVGEGAQIDVGGLMATTLDIHDQEFIHGGGRFQGEGAGRVENQGRIHAQSRVILLAPEVHNSGDIRVEAGDIALASGTQALIQAPGSAIPVLVENSSALSLIQNQGALSARELSLIAAGSGAEIHNSGVLRAVRENGSGGQIHLRVDSGDIHNPGTVDASAETGLGGSIVVQADRYAQTGDVLANGEEQGAGGEIRIHTRDTLVLYESARIDANADRQGDGGEVIVYSEGQTAFTGEASISARGGTESGDGGFVEVSGAEFVFVAGLVDIGTSYGQAGTWYIDPSNITIDGSNGDTGSFVGPDPFHWDHGVTPPSDSIINVYTLRSALGNGNVVIDTASAANGAGNISWNAQLNFDGFSASRTLTLIADNDINVQGNGSIFDGNPGTEGLNIELYAANNILFNAASTFGAGIGTIRMEAGNNLTLAGLHSESAAENAIYLQAGNQILQDGDINSIAGAPNGGMVLVAQNGMDIDGAIGDVASIGFQNLGTGDINYNASGDLVLNSLSLGANMTANITATGNLTFTGTQGGELNGATNSSINLNAGGLIAINGSLADTVGAVDNSTHFTAISTAGFTMADGAELNVGSGLVNISTTSGGVSVSGISTSSSANNAISISATAGSLVDAGDSHIDLSAPNGGVVLNIPDGIADLEVEAASLDAQASAGNTSLNIQGGTAVRNLVGSVSALTATGDVIFDEAAAVTADTLSLATSGRVVIPDAGLNTTVNMVLSATDFDNTSGTRDVILVTPDLDLSTQASGGALSFSTSVDTLAIANTGNNSVSITDVDGFSIANLEVSSGDLQLASSAGADLVINSDIDLDGSSATLSLLSSGDLTINNAIADLSGAIDNSGNVNLSADSVLSFASTARVDAGTGNVSISSLGGNLALGEVAGSNVTLSSNAAITDANGNAVNINAVQANVSAVGDIASIADALETNVGSLSITAVNADINEADGLSLASLNVSGSLNLATAAAGDVAISESTPTVAGQLNIIVNDGDVVFNDGGLSLTGDLTVQANALRDSDASVGLAAGDVNFTLASGGADTFVTSDIDSLLIHVLGNQLFEILDANDLVVDQANSGGDLRFNATDDLVFNDPASLVDGNLSLIAGATLTVPDSGIDIAGQLLVDAQSIQDSDNTLTLAASQADIRLAGNGDTQLNTNFDSLTLQWDGASALSINESDSLSIADIVGAGSVAIRAGDDIALTTDAVNHTGRVTLTTTADIQLLDSGLSTVGNLQLDAANVVDSDRSVNLQANQLDLVLRDGAVASTFNTTATVLNLDYQGVAAVGVVNSSALTVNNISTGGDAALTVLNGDLILNDAGSSIAGDITLAAAGDLIVPATGFGAGGNLTVSADTISDGDASVILGADQANITLRSTTADATINSSFNELVLNFSGNSVSVVDSDALTVSSVNATGDASLSSTNADLTLAADSFAVGGVLNVQTLGAGNLVLPVAGFTHHELNILVDNMVDDDQSVNLFSGAANIELRSAAAGSTIQGDFDTLSLIHGGSNALNLSDSDDLVLDNLSANGDLNIRAESALTLNDASPIFAGNLALSSGADLNVTLMLDLAGMQNAATLNLLADQSIQFATGSGVVDSSGAAKDLNLNLAAGTQIHLAEGVLFNLDGDRQLNTELSAGTDIQMGETAGINAGRGSIQFMAGGDIFLAALQADNEGSAVILQAGGGIHSGGDAVVDTLGDLQLLAANGIHGIDVNAATVAAHTTAGNITLSSNDALHMVQLETPADASLSATNLVAFQPGAVIEVQDLNITSTELGVSDSGLVVRGSLSINGEDIRNTQSDGDILLAADTLNLVLNNTAASRTVNTQVNWLNVDYFGSQALSIINHSDLALGDLNWRGGELSIISSEGNNVTLGAVDLDGNSGLLILESGNNLVLNGDIVDASGVADTDAQLRFVAANQLQMADGVNMSLGAGRLELTAPQLTLANIVSSSAEANGIELSASQINQTNNGFINASNGGLVVQLGSSGLANLNASIAELQVLSDGTGSMTLNNQQSLDVVRLGNLADFEINLSNGDLTISDGSANVLDGARFSLGNGILYVPDSGLNLVGDLSVSARSVRDSDGNVTLAADLAEINVLDIAEDAIWQSDFNELRLNHQGSTNLSLFNQKDLNLLDVQSGGDTSFLVNGNFSIDNISAVDNLNIATLGNGTLQLGANGLRANNAIVVDVADILSDAVLTGIRADISLRNGTQPINIQTSLNQLSLEVNGSASSTVNANGGLMLGNLSSLGEITIQSDSVLELNNASADVQGTLQLMSQSDLLLNAQTFTNSGALELSAASLQNANGGALRLYAPSADIQLSGSEALVLDGEVSNLVLNVQSSEAVYINNSDDLFLDSLIAPNATSVNLNVSGALGFSNNRLSIPGELNLAAENLSTASGQFGAQNITLGLTNATGDYQWQVETNHFDLDLNGPASAQISSSQTLTLRDNNGDGLAVDIENGNFTVLSSSGDINVEGDVIARDQIDDGLRQGVIDLQAAGGDINIGLTRAVNLTSQNLVDQDVGNTLQESGGIKLQLRDTSSTARSIRLGNGLDAVKLTAIGGDILLDTGINNTPAGSVRSVIESDSARILAYNIESDSANGSVQINGQDVTQSGGQLIRSGRALVIADSRELPNEKYLESVDDVEGSTKLVEQEQDQGADVAAQYEKAYGSCNEFDDPASSKCRIDNALKAFLSHWLVGGELPPKSEIR